jgi:hypothetical protein
MSTKRLIEVNEFCVSHQIEVSFISSLRDTGLIEVLSDQESVFFDSEQLQQVEKFIRFHYDLDINIEGIECIDHLLKRTAAMQDEIASLRNRLSLYE